MCELYYDYLSCAHRHLGVNSFDQSFSFSMFQEYVGHEIIIFWGTLMSAVQSNIAFLAAAPLSPVWLHEREHEYFYHSDTAAQ